MALTDKYKELTPASDDTWTFDWTKVVTPKGTTVASFVLTEDAGVTVAGDAIGANPLGVVNMVVNFKLTADAPADDFGTVYQVKCKMTDSAGNVVERWMYFTLVETI